MIITLRDAYKRKPALKAIVDNDLPKSMLKKIRERTWHRYVSPSGVVYAASRKGYLHRLLLGAKETHWVRFINGNGLDCRKRNMRLLDSNELVASTRRRVRTKSGFRGVNNIGGKLPWQMRLSVRGRKYRSVHKTAREAALAYDKACKAHLGPIAVTNKSMGKLR